MAEHRTRNNSKEQKAHGNVIKYGDRMRETLVRSKHTARNLSQDGQDNAEGYAVDNAAEGSRKIIHDTALIAGSGARNAVERGRRAAVQEREKKQDEERKDRTQINELEVPESEEQALSAEGAKEHNFQSKEHYGKDVPEIAPTGTSPGEKEFGQSAVSAGREYPLQRKPSGNPEMGIGTFNSEIGIYRKESYDPHYPNYSARRKPATIRRETDRRSESFGTVSRIGSARDSSFARNAEMKTAGRTDKAFRQVQNSQAFAAAKQKAIVSARTKRSLQRGITAAVEQTRKVAAGAGAIAGGGAFVIVILMVILFLFASIATSGFGIFFSPEANKQSDQKLPAVVREINTEFQNRIENIKQTVPHDAVELFGARAQWPEILSVYAVKTTTDPEGGMEVATMDVKKKDLLKRIFWDMNSISYDTETEVYTSTIKTTDSEGHVIEKEIEETYTTLIITVSHQTVEEAAEAYRFKKGDREQLDELLAMDRSLWNAVLYGISNGDYGKYGDLVQVALSQVGNIGGEPYWSWYGFSSRVEWCACFVSWCADQCGYIDDGLILKYAGCPSGVQWFKDRGQWLDRYDEPEPGMIIFYDWDKESTGGQDGISDHTGIVEFVEDGMVHTIEGNWGDSCAQRELPVGQYEIMGYGYMTGE